MATTCPECGGPMAKARPIHHPEGSEGPVATATDEDPRADPSTTQDRFVSEDAETNPGVATKTVDMVCSRCGAVVPMAV